MLDPAAASDLSPSIDGNRLEKYADDTYLIVPPGNSHLIVDELANIQIWAKRNNLNLNDSKTKELVVRRPRTKANTLPTPLVGVERVDVMNVLGVLIDGRLSFREHIDWISTKSAQSLYALRNLRAHGLWTVTEATLISRITYASQSWWGFIGSGDLQRIESVIRRVTRQGFLAPDRPDFVHRCAVADSTLINQVLSNRLHHLLPDVKKSGYHLRPRAHDRVIPHADSLLRKTFIHRSLNSK